MSLLPLVTVIIPVFNGARYIGEAIESVLQQDYNPLELIVVDDGSTDETAVVVARFGDDVHYVYQKNQGAAAARNRGIALARGAYIAFLDADDCWLPLKLQQQTAVFEANPQIDVVFGHIRYFISPDIATKEATRLHCPPNPLPGMLPSTMLVKQQLFERVGQFETVWQTGEFVSWFARARELGVQEWMLPEVVATRRLHDQNQGVRKREAMRDYLRIVQATRNRRQNLDK